MQIAKCSMRKEFVSFATSVFGSVILLCMKSEESDWYSLCYLHIESEKSLPRNRNLSPLDLKPSTWKRLKEMMVQGSRLAAQTLKQLSRVFVGFAQLLVLLASFAI